MSFRTYRDLSGEDRSQLLGQVVAQRERVARRLEGVRRVVAVMSGKGGVGKSFVTAHLAQLAAGGTRIGVVDADLKSPTVARLLGARGPLAVSEDGVEPAAGHDGIRVVSTDLLLDEGQPLTWREPSGDGFVWRGTLEAGTLREFLSDVRWGELDLLLVDLPPGADGITDLAALVPALAGAVAVTIPSVESRRSVARAMRTAREAGVPLLGVVENMSGIVCPDCGSTHPLFEGDAGPELAAEFDVPLLARVPFAPRAAESPDALSSAVPVLMGGSR